MTLSQIEYFLELCRTMNFTKAASNLYITQPTLSRQIQLLETELNTQLLKRSNREVILTPAGEVFKEEFLRISDKIDTAVEKVKHANVRKQELRVGFSDAVLPVHIFNLIHDLKAYFVETTFFINQYANTSYELKKFFENGTLDVVVSLEPIELDASGLLQSDFWELPGYVVYSPNMFPEGYEPTLEDFKGKRMVCTSRNNSENIVKKQREILENVGMADCKVEMVENVVTTLMYTDSENAFSIFCNNEESPLKTMPLPNNTVKFKMVAYWRKNSEFPLEGFFAETVNRSWDALK